MTVPAGVHHYRQVVVLALLAGTMLAALHLQVPHLDLDEAFALLLRGQAAGDIVAALRADSPPPLFYLLTALLPAATPLAVCRLVPLLALLAAGFILLRLARRLTRGAPALLLLLLLPFSIVYLSFSLYYRYYALLAPLLLLTLNYYLTPRGGWKLLLAGTALALVAPVGELYVLLFTAHAAIWRRWQLRWLALPLLAVILWQGYQGFLPAQALQDGNPRLAWMPPLTAANLLPTLVAMLGALGWHTGMFVPDALLTLLLLACLLSTRGPRALRALLVLLWLGPPLFLLAMTWATGTNHLVGRALFPAPLLFLLVAARVLRRWPLPAIMALLLLALLPTFTGGAAYLASYRTNPLRYPLAARPGVVAHSSLLSAFPLAVLAPGQRHLVVAGAGVNCPAELAAAAGIEIVPAPPPAAYLVNLPEAPGALTVSGRRLLVMDYQWEQPLEYWLPHERRQQ